ADPASSRYPPVREETLPKLLPRLERAMSAIRAETPLDVDRQGEAIFFATEMTGLIQRTSVWHQDPDFFFLITGDHTHYVNLYIPVVKPDAERSNVEVIPFDALESASPAAFDLFHGGGASFLSPRP